MFGDEATWSKSQLQAAYLGQSQTAAGDVLWGFSGNDTMQGGTGDDRLYGYSGTDTYTYNAGDGNDRIYEDQFGGNGDRLVLGAGLTTDKLVFERSGNHVTLRFAGYAGGIYLDQQFGSNDYGVEQIVFGDSTVWTKQQLLTAYNAYASSVGGQTFNGTAGSDTLQGGSGDDVLVGNGGNDTYVYNAGGGNDRIFEGLSSGNGDRLSLGAGLTADILTFDRVGTSVTLHFAAQSGSIYLDRQFEGFDNGVEQIAFANGTIWTKADLQSAYLASVQTVGSDVVEGFGTNDTLQGGVGDDQLYGDYGNDTYAYNAGDGNDRIFEGLSSGNGDRLSLGAGLTADILTFDRVGTSVTLHFAGQSGSIYLERQFEDFDNGVEQIAFANGTVWTKADLQSAYLARIQTAGSDLVEGFGSNDTPQGGAGDDQLYGDYGNDTYAYNAGDGNDRIFEGLSSGNGDRLSLGAGLTADVLTFDRVGTGVTLRFAGQSGSIYLDRQFEGFDNGVEQIAFASGAVWTKADLQNAYLAGVQTVGSDVVEGFGTNDTLQGGAGDDQLYGDYGNDVYVYNAGDGNDRIFEGMSTGNGDRLSLGAGLTADVLTFDRVGTSVTLRFAGGGSIYLDRQFEGYDYGVEQIAFANGTTWTKLDRSVFLSTVRA